MKWYWIVSILSALIITAGMLFYFVPSSGKQILVVKPFGENPTIFQKTQDGNYSVQISVEFGDTVVTSYQNITATLVYENQLYNPNAVSLNKTHSIAYIDWCRGENADICAIKFPAGSTIKLHIMAQTEAGTETFSQSYTAPPS